MKSVAFSQVANFSLQIYYKETLLHGCLSRFLICANGTKSRKASQIFAIDDVISTIKANGYGFYFLVKLLGLI